jgi:hypothetical protein
MVETHAMSNLIQQKGLASGYSTMIQINFLKNIPGGILRFETI